ncbi:MAG TPA: hypothetical protein VFS37_10885 [Conexibacter sp.]|nr:hypothetical protein [Conexibacter sp.]
MTPPAATAAARRAVAGPAGSASRPARRVSGPIRPARPAAVPRPARRGAELPLGARALAWLRTLPDHRLLDRLIGGRVWIVLLGGMLVGIVTMQLTLLRWNAGIGRAVERSSQLEQRNAALRLAISELSDTNRIVAMASQMGYVMPSQGSPRFLTAGAGDAAKALTTMRVPDPNAAAAAAAELAASTQATTDPATTTPADPTATAPDPAATTTPATTTPSATTTTPATTDPATTATPTSATAPTTAAPAGGASAPQG